MHQSTNAEAWDEQPLNDLTIGAGPVEAGSINIGPADDHSMETQLPEVVDEDEPFPNPRLGSERHNRILPAQHAGSSPILGHESRSDHALHGQPIFVPVHERVTDERSEPGQNLQDRDEEVVSGQSLSDLAGYDRSVHSLARESAIGSSEPQLVHESCSPSPPSTQQYPMKQLGWAAVNAPAGLDPTAHHGSSSVPVLRSSGSLGGDSQDQSPTSGQLLRTSYSWRACIRCRTQKARCDRSSVAGGAPCEKCTRSNTTCSFETDPSSGPTQLPESSSSGIVSKSCERCRRARIRCTRLDNTLTGKCVNCETAGEMCSIEDNRKTRKSRDRGSATKSACKDCRRSKVKCVLNELESGCERCSRSGFQCSFQIGTDGNTKKLEARTVTSLSHTAASMTFSPVVVQCT